MGTSVNQRSPDTPNWNIVQDAYDNPNFPVAMALREVWRAALNQPEGNLLKQLAEPSIANIGSLATLSDSPADVGRLATEFIADSQNSSLAAAIATRAAMQSAGRADSQEFFIQRLFAEATNYLVARDLPGHITPGRRLETPSEARNFRHEMIRTTTDVVQRTPKPKTLQAQDWSDFVDKVATAIRRSS